MTAKLMDKTTLKFFLVGIINTIVGTTVMFLLYNLLGVNYWFSTASNYIAGSVASYFLNKHFTFHSREKSIKQVIKFAVTISVCYLLAYGIAKPLVSATLTSLSVTTKENIAMLVGMGLFVMLNYLGQRFFVFKEKA